MFKKVSYVFLILLFLAFVSKSCIKADNPEAEKRGGKSGAIEDMIGYKADFPPPETVAKNGIDYLQTQAPIGKFGGNFITSVIGEGPKTFNPWNSKDATSSSLAGLMFDGLLATDMYTGEVEPRLAKSFTVAKDGKTYIFHLRRGVKWSDNRPVTADDVVFTYETIIFKGFGNPSTRDSMLVDGVLPSIKKIDDYTVKFTTPKPFAPFLRQLTTPIAPKHVFEPVTKKGARYFETFYGSTTKPKDFVTSGAFRLQEYVPAQRVVFVRNSDYYVINKEGKKLPYLDKYIALIVGDLNNELLKFKAGELDIIDVRGADVALFKEKEKNSDYKLFNLGPTTSTMFFLVNQNQRKNDKGQFYVMPKKQYWFNNRDFREALDYAIDRENMIFNIANGVAQPLFTAEALPSLFLNKELAKGHEQDIERSKTLLAKNGFYWGKDCKLYDKFNNKVEFDLYTNAGNTEREAIGVMIKQDLAEIGITVNFKPIEFNTLVNKMTNTLDWDSVILGLTGSPLDPHDGKNVWDSQGTLHLFNKRLHGEKDLKSYEKRLDKIFVDASLEMNEQKRKDLYDEYQKIVYDEALIQYLYSPIRISAIRKKFGNVFPTPLGGVVHNLEEIYIK